MLTLTGTGPEADAFTTLLNAKFHEVDPLGTGNVTGDDVQRILSDPAVCSAGHEGSGDGWLIPVAACGCQVLAADAAADAATSEVAKKSNVRGTTNNGEVCTVR